MAEETEKKVGFLAMAVEAVAFNKVIVIGLLVVLMVDVGASFYLASKPLVDAKTTEFVLAFFKDMALIIVGAIAGLLQHKSDK